MPRSSRGYLVMAGGVLLLVLILFGVVEMNNAKCRNCGKEFSIRRTGQAIERSKLFTCTECGRQATGGEYLDWYRESH
jgi:ribosomal protein L37AE/L43A